MAAPILFAELTDEERKRLVRHYPAIGGGEPVVLISASRAMLTALEQVAEQVAWERKQSERVLEALVNDDDRVLNEPRVLQLHRQAEARANFLGRFETLSSGEVAALSRSNARNTSALANRWKKEGKIFAVSVGRVDHFPGFQFGDDGKPLPAIADVIQAFAGQSPWAIALWFAAPSGWLNGQVPADVIRTDPAAVVEAARRATEPLIV